MSGDDLGCLNQAVDAPGIRGVEVKDAAGHPA